MGRLKEKEQGLLGREQGESGAQHSEVPAPAFKGDSKSNSSRLPCVVFPAAHLGALCCAADRVSSSLVRDHGPSFPASVVVQALAARPFLRMEDRAF